MGANPVRQRQLFDVSDAEVAKQQGIDRAERGAPRRWLDQALLCVRVLAERQATLTADDLWGLIDQPREPRALGAVMRAATAKGLVRATSEWRLSKRGACHRRPLRVWESLIVQARL